VDKLYEQAETGCCPRFKPEPWDEKEVVFKDKLFIKDSIRTFMHVPLNFGGAMVRNMETIKNAGALSSEPLMLYDAKSPWKSDVYIAVSKEVPGADNAKISGSFLSKVFEGSFSGASGWLKSMGEFVKSKGKVAKRVYFFYTTCPACARAYGKN